MHADILNMRKGQIQMAETIAVMTIFFFLVVFGFGIYTRLHNNYITEQQYRIANLKALQISQKAAYMPEFQCSRQNVQDLNCFDVMKVDIFEKMMQNSDRLRERYYESLGSSRVILQEVYPGNSSWTIYNYIEDSDLQINSMIPVSIYYGRERRYAIAILNITVSQR